MHLGFRQKIERWQNWLHKVTTLNGNMMIRSLWCVMIEVSELPTYDGLSEMDEFLRKFESAIPK